MHRLRLDPPPWRKHKRSAHVCFDLEYFYIEKAYGKYVWDTLRFLQDTWEQRQNCQEMTW